MSSMRPFFAAKFALPISVWSAVFSLVMLATLVFFVDDVASVLAVYFDLNADQKWQIIAKFKTPLLVGVSALLCFNVVTILLCTFYSTRLFKALDTMLRWLDLIIVGENLRLKPTSFSRQSAAMSNKLGQLQEEFAHSRNTSKDLQADMKTIERYLHTLQSAEIKPPPLTLTTAPEVATQLDELAAQLFPAAMDKAQ